jgi:uncharacterized protein (DUF1800 family)
MGRPQQPPTGLNENYARELMELHTLGVDGGYTQRDVQEVARCLTGWTIRQPRGEGSFYFEPRIHDGEKTVLGIASRREEGWKMVSASSISCLAIRRPPALLL